LAERQYTEQPHDGRRGELASLFPGVGHVAAFIGFTVLYVLQVGERDAAPFGMRQSDQETFSAASAINAAKQYIDNGNFMRGSPLARARSDFLH
jgi:hypothetical protein